MGSPTSTRPRSSGSKRGGAPSMRLVWVFIAVLLLVLLRCSPCQGRKLLAEEQGGEVMLHFEGGLVLRVSPSPGGDNDGGKVAAPTGFSRAARLMRSVPSPGVGH